MRNQVVALVTLSVVVAFAGIASARTGGLGTPVSELWSRLCRLSSIEKATLLVILVAYVGAHAILIQAVALADGIESASLLLASNALPWVVTAMLCLKSDGTPPSTNENGRLTAISDTLLVAVCVIISVSISTAWTLWRSNGHPVILDEALYLFQAILFRHGKAVLQMPRLWQPFLAIRQTVVQDGRAYTQYPPGWPALMAVFSTFAPVWLLGPLLMGLLVLSMSQIARALRVPSGGTMVTILVASSGIMLFWGATLMSDLPVTFLLTGSAASATKASRARNPLAWAVVSGALFGTALTVRPLSAVTFVPLLIVLAVLSFGYDDNAVRRRLFKAFVAAVLAVAPFVLAMLLYNSLTTGNAFVFGYTKANGPLESLGFGIRGFIDYSTDGVPFPSNLMHFNLLGSIRYSGRQLAIFDQECLGGFIVPLLAAGMTFGKLKRNVWLVLVAAGILPLAHMFLWFYTDDRYYLPLVPFLTAVAVIAVDHLLPRGTRNRSWFFAVMVCANLLLPFSSTLLEGGWGFAIFRQPQSFLTLVSQLTKQVPASGSTVVFISQPGRYQVGLWRLFWLDADLGSGGRLLIARDLGAWNQELVRDLPGWSVECVQMNGSIPSRAVQSPNPPTCRGMAGGSVHEYHQVGKGLSRRRQ